jgi:hypothetical protein
MNIIELAKQAYLYSPCAVWTIEKSDTFVTTHEAVHDFAALVEAAARADEREKLAAEAEKNGNNILAMQIRARGTT